MAYLKSSQQFQAICNAILALEPGSQIQCGDQINDDLFIIPILTPQKEIVIYEFVSYDDASDKAFVRKIKDPKQRIGSDWKDRAEECLNGI